MRAIFFQIFFNNHTTMASIDDESELSEAQSTVTTPFSIAARSTVSSKPPAKRTRNIPEIDLEEALDQ